MVAEAMYRCRFRSRSELRQQGKTQGPSSLIPRATIRSSAPTFLGARWGAGLAPGAVALLTARTQRSSAPPRAKTALATFGKQRATAALVRAATTAPDVHVHDHGGGRCLPKLLSRDELPVIR